MQSKKPKKLKPKKKPTTFLTDFSKPEAEPVTQAPESAAGVTSNQPATDGLAELARLEKELQSAPGPGAKPGEKAGEEQPAAEPKEAGEPVKRRRKFKRPPPENTIRMTIRQYWRFRAWMANRKLKLPPELFAAVLEGTDQTLVEPLVDPVIGIIDEYVPEQWIEFIEEKSPILTFIIALFEAEQTFGARISEIAREIREEKTTTRPANNNGYSTPAAGYPKKGEI